MKKLIFFAALAVMPMININAQNNAVQLRSDNINEVIKAMTLDEKIDLIVGVAGNMASNKSAEVGKSAALVPGAAGQTNGIPRLGIPATVLSDGPAGLRIDAKREGNDRTFYCTHFPVGTTMSATWNLNLVNQVGCAMGSEVFHYGADVLLAPATNIQRNPLNGRNFEYYSEDPLLAGKTCAAMVKGLQSNNIGTSVKHFALNNQEINRTGNNVIVSPRAIREIYLKPFEIAVKEAQPWTVMSSYNLINGTMASQRSDLLTDILRGEWGFKGAVMSDWYGGRDAVQQMRAGNDMLQPGYLYQRMLIKKAVEDGTLSRSDLDRNVRNILEYIVKTPRFKGYAADNNPDLKANAKITRNAALEGMVLMKNDGKALPLNNKTKKLAVFGRGSYDFIAGGTGSGNVNHAYVVNLIDGLKNCNYVIDQNVADVYLKYNEKLKAGKGVSGNPFEAFLPQPQSPEMPTESLNMKNIVANNDCAVITIGRSSGEFLDRAIKNDFILSDMEKAMITKVADSFHKSGKKVIVVLNVCGPVQTFDWIKNADAVLTCWLLGQEGGNSVADILSGKENPSGRLPMTWPVSYNDVPSKDDFPNIDVIGRDSVLNAIKEGFTNKNAASQNRRNIDFTEYKEGIYVGYRYYTTKNIPVSFPFGYGLSYTSFKYGDSNVSTDSEGNINVSVSVKNTGKTAGKEVVEVYVAAPGKDMNKPSRELKGFAKTDKLNPGQQHTVNISIPFASLASFNEADSQWQVEGGQYKVMIAHNAADPKPLTSVVTEEAKITEKVSPCLSMETK